MISMNAEQFQHHIRQNKPVLIEFWAPWCVYCRRITPALDKIDADYAASLVIGQVNIDDEPQLAEQERIEIVPTLLLYQNGQALGSITAPDSKAKIEEFIQNTLGW